MENFLDTYIGYLFGSLIHCYKEARDAGVAGDKQAETGFLCSALAFNQAIVLLVDKGGAEYIAEEDEVRLRDLTAMFDGILRQAYYGGEYTEIPMETFEDDEQ